MITDKTVFVLGAGASVPYDYPSGKLLKQKICEELTENPSESIRYAKNVHNISRGEYEFMKRFREELIASGTTSVDQFLETRREYIGLGKVAIAQTLIRCENPSKFFNDSNDDDWLVYLFEKISNGQSFEGLLANKLSFITFNYDRSLEYFLSTVIANKYGKTENEVGDLLNRITIIHVYGQIGFLSWQKKTPIRSYKGEYLDKLKESSDGIRIIHEDVISDEVFNKAKELLNDAVCIYLLGYGYHNLNNHRLGISMINNRDKVIKGTRYNLTDNEVESIRRRTSNKINFNGVSSGYKNLEFLRNCVAFD